MRVDTGLPLAVFKEHRLDSLRRALLSDHVMLNEYRLDAAL